MPKNKNSKKNFTNPILYSKSEKPKNEFEVNHIKLRGSVLGTAFGKTRFEFN
jgi:hypothetical protein